MKNELVSRLLRLTLLPLFIRRSFSGERSRSSTTTIPLPRRLSPTLRFCEEGIA